MRMGTGRRARTIGILGVVVVVAAACQSAGGHVRGNAALTGTVGGETTLDTTNAEWLVPSWTSSTVAGGTDDAATALGDRVVTPTGAYNVNPVGCAGTGVKVCDPVVSFTGTSVSSPGGAAPTVAGQRAYVLPASTSGATPTFAAYPTSTTASGASCVGTACPPIWQADISGYDPSGTANVGGRGAVTVVGDVIYATSEATGHLFAFSTSTAGCTGSAPASCPPIWAGADVATANPPAVAGGFAYVATATTPTREAGIVVYATDDQSGCTAAPVVCEPAWTGTLGTTVADPTTMSPPIVSGYSAYVVAGNVVYAFSSNGTTNCAGAPKTCTPVWYAALPSSLTPSSAPALSGTTLYVPTDDGIVLVNTTTHVYGTTFAYPDPGSTPIASGITIANGVLLVGTTDGLVAYDATCTAACAPLLHTLDGKHVTTPAVLAGKVHLLADGTAYTLIPVEPIPPIDPDPTQPYRQGSTRNYLGTGSLLTGAAGTVTAREGFWLAISGRCTEKHQGERYASAFFNGSSANNTCVGTANPEHDDTYDYVITVPDNRESPIDIVVFHGNFVDGATVTSEFNPGGSSSIPNMNTTFALHAPDDTPLDDADNPTTASLGTCSAPAAGTDGTKTFTPGVTDDNYSLSISQVTNATGMWRLCTLPVEAPSGRYILRVRNQATIDGATVDSEGSNDFALFAIPTAPAMRLCDNRTDPTCPTITAKPGLGVHISPPGGSGGTAEFSALVADPELRGRTVVLEAWDVGEGATKIEILRPTGSTTWAPETFSWTASGGASGTDVTQISNAGGNLPYNGQLISITFTVPDVEIPVANPIWRVRYTFLSGATDRSTWSARVLP